MDHSNHKRHEHHKRAPQQDEGGTRTVVEVVFVTQAPDFDGDPAGFVTSGADSIPSLTPLEEAPSPTPTPRRQSSNSKDEEDETTRTTFQRSTTRRSTETDGATTSSDLPSRTSAGFNSATSSLESSTPSPTGSSSGSGGTSIGTYAGIAGGAAVLIVLLVAALILIKRKKRNSKWEKPEDEKNLNRLSFNDRAPPSPVPMPKPITPAVAPKLQIRPMTQFDGSFFPAGNSETSKSEDRPLRAPPPALSMDRNNLGPGPFETPEPSPAMSAFSDSSNMTLPIQGQTGPAQSAVHRVMVDFKPSMADELELRAGEVVRMLHEYDDGWALCIRMDRSQQGVCPRTCLSQRPVKPRPPPGAQSPRAPPTPTGMRAPPRPQSPGGRPQSPGMGPGSRPQSPRGPGPNRPPLSPKGMPGPPKGPLGPDSRPSSPMGNRQPHPLSRVQREDDIQFHAM